MNIELLLEDIKSFLTSHGITVPIYISSLPDDVVPCMAVYEYPGEGPDTNVDIDKPRIQVKLQVGRTDYKNGRKIMADVQSILHRRCNTPLDNNYLIDCFSINGVIPLQKDPEGNVEFLSNFRTQIR